LGTPNNGSPWSNVVDLSLLLLTLGLNGLAAATWSISTVAALIHLAGATTTTGMERSMTTSLKEMQPDSTFVKTLFLSDSPGIPYTAIAGNTSLISLQTTEAQTKIKTLLQRVVGTMLDLPFMGDANDIAVKVSSIIHLPQRSPAPTIAQVACDHLTYFNHPAGLKALSDAVQHALNLNLESPISADPVCERSSAQTEVESVSASRASRLSNRMVALIVVGLSAIALISLFLWRQPQKQQQPATQLNTTHGMQ
ncbi:hypothetical protein IQ250_29025, partial [Pseudanabaenaceae cyanobacterium LEGE 13415]|nr:hypothetical protein [Pseudanabaenaceae cyanobacterium LEGE 13415]